MNINKRIIPLLLSILLALPLVAFAAEAPIPHTPQRLLVQYETGVDAALKTQIRGAAGVTAVKPLGPAGLELVTVNPGQSESRALGRLNNLTGVRFAEPDAWITLDANPSNDPYYDLLWGFNQSNDMDIDAPEAWDLTSGSNTVVVAVIDTAIDPKHPDLQGLVIDSQKFHLGPAVYTHGTHVAGTIAANDNALGVIGIAPEIRIMSLAFLGKAGGYTSDAILAIQYATAHGADLINASWGGGSYSLALKEAIDGFPGPFVAAAGNDGSNTDIAPHYPSSYDSANIVSVAAIDSSGALAGFSNYGTATVDLAAPGVGILSTYPGGYAYMNGTSMAAPHVTGTLALMMSYSPSLTTPQLLDALYTSGKALPSLSGKVATGAMVKAYGALQTLEPPAPDLTPPTVVATKPVDGSMDVSPEETIEILFDEPVLLSGTPVTLNGIAAGIHVLGSTLRVDPAEALAYSTEYTVVVPIGAITDTSGNPTESEIAFSFTTSSQPPATSDEILIIGTLPGEGAVNIRRTQNISFYMSEAFTSIDAGAIHFTNDLGQPVAFVARGEGTTELKLDPSDKLDPNTTFTITLDPGAVSSGTSVSVGWTLHFTSAIK